MGSQLLECDIKQLYVFNYSLIKNHRFNSKLDKSDSLPRGKVMGVIYPKSYME